MKTLFVLCLFACSCVLLIAEPAVISIQNGAALSGHAEICGHINIQNGSSIKSTGVLTIHGDVVLDGTLKSVVDGAGSGAANLLDVDGSCILSNGMLQVVETNPIDDFTYVLLRYTTVAGAFTNTVNKPADYRLKYLGKQMLLYRPCGTVFVVE